MRACHITPSTLRDYLSNKPINKLCSSKYFTIIYLLYCRITRLSHFFSHSSILALLSAVLFSIFYSLDSMFKCDVLLFVLLFRLTLRFHISSIVFCVVNHYCMFAPQYALSVQPSSTSSSSWWWKSATRSLCIVWMEWCQMKEKIKPANEPEHTSYSLIKEEWKGKTGRQRESACHWVVAKR